MKLTTTTTRRDFIKKAALSASLIPFLNFPLEAFANSTEKDRLSVHIFSKHLQFLGYEEVGKIAKDLGFSGVDLTVRPKGHVLPESVKMDLPKAIEAIQKGGSNCEMITTAIESIHNPLDVDVLTAAADLGVQYYRTNWFKYVPKN